MVRDDPNKIARYLAEEHGLGSARKVVSTETQTAQREGDNYGLSVWREVKVILANSADDEIAREASG